MRRIGCIIALIVGLLIVALVVYFASGLVGEPAPVSSRDPRFERLVAAAPDEASVLVAGQAGPFWMSLRDDDLLGSIIEEQSSADLDLAALLLGKSGLAIWETPEGTGFATDVGGLRRQILLLASRFSDSIPPLETRDGLLVSRGGAGSRMEGVSVPGVEGEAVIRHGSDSESWPPLEPPSVTSVNRVDGGGLVLRSVAHARGPAPDVPARFPFEVPADAVTTVTFWQRHEALEAIGKMVPVDLGTLSANGAALAVWDVETDGLLPQIRGVLMIPRTEESAAGVGRMFSSAAYPEELGLLAGEVSSRTVANVRIDTMRRLGMTFEAATVGPVLVLAFDARSMDLFLRSARAPQTPREGHVWRVVADVERLSPILADLGDDRALRLIARDFQRSVREFENVLRRFRRAAVLEADRLSDGRTETFELTLRPAPAK